MTCPELDEAGNVDHHTPASFEDRGRAYQQSHITHPPGVVADSCDQRTVHAFTRAVIEERT